MKPILLVAFFVLNSLSKADVIGDPFPVLPEHISIKVGDKGVDGFRGDPDDIRQSEARGTMDRFPSEGFVFEVDANQNKVNVHAWSSEGRTAMILKIAEDTVEAMVKENREKMGEDVVGVMTSGRDHLQIGRNVSGIDSAKHHSATAKASAAKPEPTKDSAPATVEPPPSDDGLSKEAGTAAAGLGETSPVSIDQFAGTFRAFLIFLSLCLAAATAWVAYKLVRNQD